MRTLKQCRRDLKVARKRYDAAMSEIRKLNKRVVAAAKIVGQPYGSRHRHDRARKLGLALIKKAETMNRHVDAAADRWSNLDAYCGEGRKR